MPSSLTEGRPPTLVCSTRPPVSVCGTVAVALARGFSRRSGLDPHGSGRSPPLTLASRSESPGWICLPRPPTGLEGPKAPGPSPPRPPITDHARPRDGNLNPLSIAYALRPRLRPASPAADQPGCGTLGHSVGGIRTPLALLMPTFALPAAPRRASAAASLPTGTLPYHAPGSPGASAASAPGLAPVDCRRRGTSTSELLRTLSRMAASKPTSWLSARRDLLAH